MSKSKSKNLVKYRAASLVQPAFRIFIIRTEGRNSLLARKYTVYLIGNPKDVEKKAVVFVSRLCDSSEDFREVEFLRQQPRLQL